MMLFVIENPRQLCIAAGCCGFIVKANRAATAGQQADIEPRKEGSPPLGKTLNSPRSGRRINRSVETKRFAPAGEERDAE